MRGLPRPLTPRPSRQLARIRGAQDAIDAVRALVAPLGCVADLDDFQATYDLLGEAGLADSVLVDFSVASSFNYYTGLVFEAWLALPGPRPFGLRAAATTA